jgi:hypothetical protein
MSLVVQPRSAELAPFVRALGCVGAELPPGWERVLPSGNVTLMVNL